MFAFDSVRGSELDSPCDGAPACNFRRADTAGPAASRDGFSSIVIVLVTVVGMRMTMRMGVSCPVLMDVFMLVEDDFQAAPEGVGDPTQGRETRHVIASLKAGDHRLGHLHALRELLLCLAGMFAQFEKPVGALCGDGAAVVEACAWLRAMMRLLHWPSFAKLLSSVNRP